MALRAPLPHIAHRRGASRPARMSRPLSSETVATCHSTASPHPGHAAATGPRHSVVAANDRTASTESPHRTQHPHKAISFPFLPSLQVPRDAPPRWDQKAAGPAPGPAASLCPESSSRTILATPQRPLSGRVREQIVASRSRFAPAPSHFGPPSGSRVPSHALQNHLKVRTSPLPAVSSQTLE